MKKLFLILNAALLFSCAKEGSNLSNESNTGKNGSLTRFAIKDDFMYAVDLNYLKVFDISKRMKYKIPYIMHWADHMSTVIESQDNQI